MSGGCALHFASETIIVQSLRIEARSSVGAECEGLTRSSPSLQYLVINVATRRKKYGIEYPGPPPRIMARSSVRGRRGLRRLDPALPPLLPSCAFPLEIQQRLHTLVLQRCTRRRSTSPRSARPSTSRSSTAPSGPPPPPPTPPRRPPTGPWPGAVSGRAQHFYQQARCAAGRTRTPSRTLGPCRFAPKSRPTPHPGVPPPMHLGDGLRSTGCCAPSSRSSPPTAASVLPTRSPSHPPTQLSHWRDCHSADTLSASILKHLLEEEGGAAE